MNAELRKWMLDTMSSLEKNQAPDEKVLWTNEPTRVKERIQQPLPKKRKDFQEVLQDFEHQILPFLNRNTSPNYAAYITGSGNPAGAVAEFIKGYYNQNGLKWNNSPIAAELEQLVLQWISTFCRIPDYHQGVLTSGGSMSNLLALHFALASRFPDREKKGLFLENPMTVYCSDETHSSIERAMVFLGLGRDQLRKIPVDEQFRIRPDLLEAAILRDRKSGFVPLAIVGNAGTTNTGSIDPLEQLGRIASKYGLWFHVDGAYGLPAIRIPELTEKFTGIQQADSIIVNPHKWMYVPFEASCVLMKNIPRAIHFQPSYLMTDHPEERWESSEHTIELSKEFRALKIWFTFQYYGSEELTRYIKNDIELTAHLAALLLEKGFEVVPSHDLSILCFRYVDAEMDEQKLEFINKKILHQIESDGTFFLTGTRIHQRTFLRSYFGNPNRTKADVVALVDCLSGTLAKVTR